MTLDEAIIDFRGSSHIENGLFYTAISRVKKGDGLFLKDFNPSYIKCNKFVEMKIKSMLAFTPYIFKKIRLDEEIYCNNGELKLGYINIRGLLEGRSIEFINNDKNLQCLDYLVLADTRLDEKTSSQFLEEQLSNWLVLNRYDADDDHCHMGLLVLQGKASTSDINLEVLFEHKERLRNQVYFQILKVHFRKILLHAAFVYVRETPSQKSLERMIKIINKGKKAELIMGDLNLDSIRDKSMLDKLCGVDKCLILREPTTLNLNQLDHIIIEKSRVKNDSFATSYYNYTSDHKTIVVRIPKHGNYFTREFKVRLNFDETKETFTGFKRKPETVQESQPKKKKSADDKNDEVPTIVIKNILKKEDVSKDKRSVPIHPTLPVLRPDMISTIKDALRNRSNEALVQISTTFSNNKIPITADDLRTLENQNWLNDNIISSMFTLIAEGTPSTFFYTVDFITLYFNLGFDYFQRVRKNTGPINLSRFKRIIIPIHSTNHWSTIGIDLGMCLINY